MSVARQPDGDFYILAQEFCPNVWDRIYEQKGEASLPVDVPLLKLPIF